MTFPYSSNVSSDNFGLQALALSADDEGVLDALDAGANVNATDASGRTALMCAIAGLHWSDISVSHDESFMTPSRLRVIDTLLRRPEISLFTMNAPQHAFNDTTPLGMAVWLDMPEAVRVLLDASLDSVAVDSRDLHGSTPLMYAARDNHVETVKLLLQHGARPDLRALNYRTAIQYALSHPQVLYMCETMLRQHRMHEWKTTNKSGVLAESEELRQAVSSLPPTQILDGPLPTFATHSLNQTTDTILQYLRSDIPALCSTLFSIPSSTHAPVLLVNNRDGNGWSPVHHCASMPEPSVRALDTLYCAGADVALFTEHEQYTALHCFAFSAHTQCSSDALYQFVYHLVHDLRAPMSAQDKQGNTCIHLAAEHGHSLEVLKALLKCDTSNTVRDLRNFKGLTALEVAQSQFRIAFGNIVELSRPESSLSINTLRPGQCPIESHLEPEYASGWAPLSLLSLPSTSDFDVIGAASQLIDNLRISSPSIHHSTDVRHIKHLDSLIIEMDQLQRATIGHFRARIKEISELMKDVENDSQDTCVFLDSTLHTVKAKFQEYGLLWSQTRVSEDSELTCFSGRSSTMSSKSLKCKSTPSIIDSTCADAPNLDTPKKSSGSTASRFVAWIKRKSSANALSKASPPSPTSSKKDVQIQTLNPVSDSKAPIVSALRTSPFALGVAGQDLQSLRESFISIRHLLDSAARSVSRAERILKRALKARRTMLIHLQKIEDDLFIRTTSLSAKSSLASMASVSTIASQVSTGNASFTGILAENDDEETRALRRLLLRKIDARYNGALDEIEKVAIWLRVVKDVVQGVKRRTYI